ncbi:MAG: DUF2723 domain-containing protein [Anaerolineales bacterium]|nr:DUF2723 domain-containing protein [Anaerolineales bacterium]MCW5855095.1 DUF2723 domain-containing protein [Anaerolineales bacterium]
MKQLSRQYGMPALIAVFIMGMYVLTLAPGITWANWGSDGGDYLSALATGGIPHPTGYPTYLAVAKMVTMLLPFSSWAVRGNLFSALSMLAASLCVCFLISQTLRGSHYRILAALTGSLVFAFAPLVWSQAVVTEVYGLHAFFVGLLLCLLLVPKGVANNRIFLVGLILGLGLGNHVTLAFMVPAFLLIRLGQDEVSAKASGNSLVRQLNIWPKLIGVVLGVVTAYASLLLYVHSAAPVRWLNPVSPERFWELISARMYQFYWRFPLESEALLERLKIVLGALYEQFAFPGIFLVGCGLLVLLLEQRKPVTAVTGWVTIASVLFTMGYQTEDAHVYLIPAVLCLAVWAAFGIYGLAKKFSRSRLLSLSAGLLLVILLGQQMVKSFRLADASQDYRAIVYGERVMQEAPEGAMIFTHQDKETFSLWYFHYAEQQRPDLAVIVVPLLDYEWYLEVLSETYPNIILPASGDEVTRLSLETLNPRPSCTTFLLSLSVLDCDL